MRMEPFQTASGLALDQTYYVKRRSCKRLYFGWYDRWWGRLWSLSPTTNEKYYPVTLTGTAAVQVVVTNTAATYGVAIQVAKDLKDTFLLKNGDSKEFTLYFDRPQWLRGRSQSDRKQGSARQSFHCPCDLLQSPQTAGLRVCIPLLRRATASTLWTG